MATLNTRGLLCPACKVIIDYGAVEAAASSIFSIASTPTLQVSAKHLSVVADVACQAEVAILAQNRFSQAQYDRMHRLWMDSCDRAAMMRSWLRSGAGDEANELLIAKLLDGWAEEMLRVPREVAEGKVPA